MTERTDELDKIKNDLKNNNVIVNEQAQLIETIKTERESLKCLVEKLTNEKVSLVIYNKYTYI